MPFTAWLPEAEVAVGDTSEFSACITVIDEPDNDPIFADGFEDD